MNQNGIVSYDKNFNGSVLSTPGDIQQPDHPRLGLAYRIQGDSSPGAFWTYKDNEVQRPALRNVNTLSYEF